MSTFRHVVLLDLAEDATDEQKKDLFEKLGRLPEKLNGIRRFDFGSDLEIIEGNADLALVADFDSEDAWREYQSHADHQVILGQLKPITRGMTRIQYLVD